MLCPICMMLYICPLCTALADDAVAPTDDEAPAQPCELPSDDLTDA